MLRHLRKIAIINDASPDEVAVLSNVTEGVDGASSFGLGDNDDVQKLTIEDQQSVQDRITRVLDIRTLTGTASEETNIEGYVSNQTKVYIAGLGIDGFVLIGDKETTTGNVLLVKNQQRSDNEVYALMATKDVQPGFDPDTGLYESGFWVGENGLGGYLWGDVDSDGVADGWSAAGFSTTSFSSGQQTLEDDSTGSTAIFSRKVHFPFEGEQVTISFGVDSLTGDYATNDLIIRFIDSSDSVISTQTTNISSTGRKNVTATTPDNTVQIQFRHDIEPNTGTVTSVISDPMLSLGTSTTYTQF